MEYDPVKMRLAKVLGRSVVLRRCFFLALDILFLRAWYVRRELKRLRKELPPKPHVLDAGMGFGQYSDRMLRTFPGAKLTGLEIDPEHMYGSERYFNLLYPDSRLVVDDVRKMKLKSEQFNLCISVDVMEHVDDDMAAFKEYYRVLKPGGFFLMHTPRIQPGTAVEPYNPDPEERWTVDEHVRDGYRDSEARERLQTAGFKIVRLVRGYGGPGKLAWTILQRAPMALLDKSMWWAFVLPFYFLLNLPEATFLMWLDLFIGDHPRGGSLLVVAQKPEE